MKVIERIKNICKTRKIPISKLEQDLNFSNGYIASLKKGSIPADRLLLIANYFDLPIEYLITGEETKRHFTSEEIHLVEQFRKVLPEGQKDIQKFIEYQIYKSEG
ncbi:MAG: helix-turn-helix transcriptional regulator [Roseburia sp.]|nr:helix-turn-helix transcriptional regulator [Roseburia sp.]